DLDGLAFGDVERHAGITRDTNGMLGHDDALGSRIDANGERRAERPDLGRADDHAERTRCVGRGLHVHLTGEKLSVRWSSLMSTPVAVSRSTTEPSFSATLRISPVPVR